MIIKNVNNQTRSY